MINTEFVEDAYDYAADLVTTTARKGNRLDEQVQRLFIVTRIERCESLTEMRQPALLQIGDRPRSFHVRFRGSREPLGLPAAVEDPGELDGNVGVPRPTRLVGAPLSTSCRHARIVHARPSERCSPCPVETLDARDSKELSRSTLPAPPAELKRARNYAAPARPHPKIPTAIPSIARVRAPVPATSLITDRWRRPLPSPVSADPQTWLTPRVIRT